MVAGLWMLGAAVLRNISGWIQNSLEDNEIQSYEWLQLLSTTIRVVVVTLCAQYGLGVDESQAAAIALLAEYGFSKLKVANGKK